LFQLSFIAAWLCGIENHTLNLFCLMANRLSLYLHLFKLVSVGWSVVSFMHLIKPCKSTVELMFSLPLDAAPACRERLVLNQRLFLVVVFASSEF
jgi:hypothetical protein